MGTGTGGPGGDADRAARIRPPEVLVSTDWVAQHLKDPKVRLVETNEDILLYDTGHIPGAVKIDWTTDLNDQVVRDYIDRERLQKLLRSKGDQQRHHDRLLRRQEQLVGHLRALGAPALRRHQREDPGRRAARWVEEGRQAHHRDVRRYPAGNITLERAQRRADPRVPRRRARAPEEEGPAGGRAEPRGVPRRAHPHARVPAGGLPPRRPHPGRQEHPVGQGDRPRRRTRSSPRPSCRKLYEQDNGLKQDEETIAYCRIGERSSPHLVRAHLPARLRQRAQLRRLVDRVGQRGAAAGGEAVGSSYPGAELPRNSMHVAGPRVNGGGRFVSSLFVGAEHSDRCGCVHRRATRATIDGRIEVALVAAALNTPVGQSGPPPALYRRSPP